MLHNKTGRIIEKNNANELFRDEEKIQKKKQAPCTSKEMTQPNNDSNETTKTRKTKTSCDYNGTLKFLPFPMLRNNCKEVQTIDLWHTLLSSLRDILGSYPKNILEYTYQNSRANPKVQDTSSEKGMTWYDTFTEGIKAVKMTWYDGSEDGVEVRDEIVKRKNKNVCILVSHKDRIRKLIMPPTKSEEKVTEQNEFGSAWLFSRESGNWQIIKLCNGSPNDKPQDTSPVTYTGIKYLSDRFAEMFTMMLGEHEVDIIVCEHGHAMNENILDAPLTPYGMKQSQILGENLLNFYAQKPNLSGSVNIIPMASYLNRSQHTALIVGQVMTQKKFPVDMENLLLSFNRYSQQKSNDLPKFKMSGLSISSPVHALQTTDQPPSYEEPSSSDRREKTPAADLPPPYEKSTRSNK